MFHANYCSGCEGRPASHLIVGTIMFMLTCMCSQPAACHGSKMLHADDSPADAREVGVPQVVLPLNLVHREGVGLSLLWRQPLPQFQQVVCRKHALP